jgi:GNAT superfamily N-acetyltransferase
MLFATASLARRIEDAEQTLVADVARAIRKRAEDEPVYVEAIGGGVAVFAGVTSPFNKVAGLGFAPLDDDTLGRVERAFADRGTPVQVEISTLADPSIAEGLTRRGYLLRGFENVLGRSLAEAPEARWSAGIRVTLAPDESREWIDVVTTGFVNPDRFDGPASHETFSRETLDQVFADTSVVPGFQRFLAYREETVAGGAGMRMWNGVAQMCGAATLPEHRRRGVQTALLEHRLAEAARSGCDIAVVTTQPGSKSQENVQRQGFALLYSRAVLVRPM